MVTTALNYLKKNKRYREEMVFAEMPLHPVSDENPIVNLDARQLGDLIRLWIAIITSLEESV